MKLKNTIHLMSVSCGGLHVTHLKDVAPLFYITKAANAGFTLDEPTHEKFCTRSEAIKPQIDLLKKLMKESDLWNSLCEADRNHFVELLAKLESESAILSANLKIFFQAQQEVLSKEMAAKIVLLPKSSTSKPRGVFSVLEESWLDQFFHFYEKFHFYDCLFLVISAFLFIGVISYFIKRRWKR